MKSSRYKWTIKLTLLTPFLALLSLFLMGGGYGWATPTMILFPFGSFILIWENQLSIPLLIIGLLQYPAYGLIIDRATSLKQRQIRTVAIVICHLALAIIIICRKNPEWR